MNHINELTTTLNNFFNWHKSRMNCFVQILLGLFSVKTVNLTEIACSFASNAKKESSYRRLQRFFNSFTIDLNLVALFVFNLFDLSKMQRY